MKNNNNATIDIQELFQDLRVSQRLAEELLLLLKEENEALQKMDIRALTGLAKQKETTLIKIHYLDNRIAATVHHYFSKKGKKLVDLVPLLPKDQATVLLQHNINLIGLRQDIQTKNLINKRFTGDTLLFINDAISLITARPKKNQLYSCKGMAPYSDRVPTMISREV